MALVPTAHGVTNLVNAPGAGDDDPVRYAVGFHGVPRDMQAGDTYNGAEVLRVDKVLHFAVVLADAPALFEARTAADDDVRYVEMDPERQLIQYTPNDPLLQYQYGPEQVNAYGAWDTTLGDTSASACVVDTGVRYTHEDLEGPRWKGGYDFSNGDSDPWDDNGHGTHVTGTAAAGLDNAIGIAGMGNVAFYHVKALNSNGGGTLSDIASAIRWCADNAGDRVVISLSLGASSGATSLKDAVDYAWGKGALVIAAAGNDGPCTNCVSYPAAYANAVAVTCTDENKAQCGFSSEGPEAEIAAPGDTIASTWNSGDDAYRYSSGTSMSTPHVSGAAALVWSDVNTLSNSDLRNILQDTAVDLGTAGRDDKFGYGLMEVAAALDAAHSGGGGGGGETLVYREAFEDGAPGWHKSGGSSDLWRLSGGCLGYTEPANSLQFNRGDSACNYDTGSQVVGWARSPVIDLSAYAGATLRFNHDFEVESYSGGAYDVMTVQVSADGGSSWTTIQQWDSRDTSNPGTWDAIQLDVSSYTTADFRVRYHFDSIDGSYNNYAGWAVDEVEVWGE